MTETEPSLTLVASPVTRRKARRRRVFKGARLVLGGGLAEVECIVKDVSATGARIRLLDPAQFGGNLRLAFPNGEELDARVMRNSGIELGIRFKPGQRPSLAPPVELIEQVLLDMESSWLGDVLDQLAMTDAIHDPEVGEAAAQLREAYDRLKGLVERHTEDY